MAYHLTACLLCSCVLALGIRTTSDLDWPFDPDHLRDIAQAQTIRDGGWLQDPFYRDEWVWYNPLLPAAIAGISYLSDLPINVVATRAGAYLNLAAPLAFYLLVLRLTGPPTALASLVGLLFLVHAPTWAAPGYSPWLFGSAAAQPFFYLSLAEYYAASTSQRRWRYVTAGILLGLTFLTHTAPAIVAGSTIVTVTIVRTAIERRPLRELAIVIAMVIGPAVVVALPFLVSIVGHYQLAVRNWLPMIWADPRLPADDWRPLLAMIGPRPLINSLIAVGTIALLLGRSRRLTALIVLAWTVYTITFFTYNNYIVPHLRQSRILAMLPAHHFLMYERAGEMVLVGLGLTWTVTTFVRLVRRVFAGRLSARAAGVLERGVTAAALGAIVVYSYPAFVARDAFGYERDAAKLMFATPELRSVVPWIRDNSAPSDVFLTGEDNCLSLVGAAGRKCVATLRFFSNPYVDWNVRDREWRSLWDSLTHANCDRFHEQARANGVTHVMTVEGRTPRIQADQCSVGEAGFAGAGVRIYRLP